MNVFILTLALDSLDDTHASYRHDDSGARLTVRREVFDQQGRPNKVHVTLSTELVEPVNDNPYCPLWPDPCDLCGPHRRRFIPR